MSAPSTLVIYCPAATAPTLAEHIAHAIDAEVERLAGAPPAGWADPAARELGVVLTPDWRSPESAPVRAYFEAHRGRFPQVAFLVAGPPRDHDPVFAEMAKLAGRKPIACVGTPFADGAVDGFVRRLARFAAALRCDEATGWAYAPA